MAALAQDISLDIFLEIQSATFLDTLHSDYEDEDEDNSNGKNTQWAGWWREREEV